jgi:DNA-binding transcriptional LysR family regulator
LRTDDVGPRARLSAWAIDAGSVRSAITLPSRLARRLVEKLPMTVVDLPLQVASLSPAMIWHERVHGDPAHVWLRQQLVDIAGA